MATQKSKNKIQSKGFSIIELILVLAIFSVIMTAATGLFISIIQQQKNISREQEILNQASFALEYMSRAIRSAIEDEGGSCLGSQFQGYIYLLTRYDAAAGVYRGIKFISDDNDCQEFFIDDADGILKEVRNADAPQNILSSSELEGAVFVVNGDKALQGAFKGDLLQPRLTVLLKIIIDTGDAQQERVIQTTISERNLNI